MKLSNRSRRAVLRFINRVRKELGKKPVRNIAPGWPGESYDCPIHNSIWPSMLGKAINGETIELKNGTRIPFSKAAQNFIERFDENEYPHLDLSTSEGEKYAEQLNQKRRRGLKLARERVQLPQVCTNVHAPALLANTRGRAKNR